MKTKVARHIVTSDLPVLSIDGAKVRFVDNSWLDLSNGHAELHSPATIAWRPTRPYQFFGFLKPDVRAPRPRRGSFSTNTNGITRNFTRWG